MRAIVSILLVACVACNSSTQSPLRESDAAGLDGADDENDACDGLSPNCSNFEGCPAYEPWLCRFASGVGDRCGSYAFPDFPDMCAGGECRFLGGGPTSCPGDEIPCCSSAEPSSCRCVSPSMADAGGGESCYSTACPAPSPWSCPCLADADTNICCEVVDTGGCTLTGPGPASCSSDEPYICCESYGSCRCSAKESKTACFCFPWMSADGGASDAGAPDALDSVDSEGSADSNETSDGLDD